jgi:NAD+--asparagine ADP-ribosyltransferase
MNEDNIIENFVWESYEIIWRTEIQKVSNKSKKQSSSKLDEIVKKYTLNLYLIDRFNRDPGFKQFLIREIESNIKAGLNIKGEIEQIKYYLRRDSSVFNFSDTPEIKFKTYDFKYKNSSINFGDKRFEIAKSKSIIYDKEIKIDFFKKRLEIAKSKNDINEIEALESLIYETETRDIKSYDPFNKNDIFESKPSLLTAKSKKYATTNINCFNLYLQDQLLSPLILLPELSLDLVNYLLKTYHPNTPQKEKDEDFTGNELKFVWDCFFLHVIYWFEKKDEKQKLSVLNREYYFSLEKADILNFLKIHEYSFLIEYAHSLFESRYTIEATKLFEFLSEYEYLKSDDEKTILTVFLAYCYKTIGQYDTVIKKHEEALHLIEELEKKIIDNSIKPKNNKIISFFNYEILDISKAHFLKVFCLKNLAEIYSLMAILYDYNGKKAYGEKRDEYFNQAIQISDNLSNKSAKFLCYYFISDGYRNIQNYDNYMIFLKKANLSLPKIRTEEIKHFEKNVKERLIHKNEMDMMSTDFLIERYRKKEIKREIGEALTTQFQLSRAIEYYKQPMTSQIPDEQTDLEIGVCYLYKYLMDKNNIDEKGLEKCIENSKKYLKQAEDEYKYKTDAEGFVQLFKGIILIAQSLELNNLQMKNEGIDVLDEYIQSKDIKEPTSQRLDRCIMLLTLLNNKQMLEDVFDSLLIRLKREDKYCLLGYAFIIYFENELALKYLNIGLESEIKIKNEDFADLWA